MASVAAVLYTLSGRSLSVSTVGFPTCLPLSFHPLLSFRSIAVWPPRYRIVSNSRAAPLPHNGSRVLDKVVYEHGPGALLVVVGEVVVDGEHEVEQQVPGIARDVTPVVFLGTWRNVM